ncbi:MAG: hypothetical protein M0P11_09730 [Anaerolineaceae bacterium]|jgi:hypothetical protein|nr:hypothetical protein [Anaerolineaceae bacterium]
MSRAHNTLAACRTLGKSGENLAGRGLILTILQGNGGALDHQENQR